MKTLLESLVAWRAEIVAKIDQLEVLRVRRLSCECDASSYFEGRIEWLRDALLELDFRIRDCRDLIGA